MPRCADLLTIRRSYPAKKALITEVSILPRLGRSHHEVSPKHLVCPCLSPNIHTHFFLLPHSYDFFKIFFGSRLCSYLLFHKFLSQFMVGSRFCLVFPAARASVKFWTWRLGDKLGPGWRWGLCQSRAKGSRGTRLSCSWAPYPAPFGDHHGLVRCAGSSCCGYFQMKKQGLWGKQHLPSPEPVLAESSGRSWLGNAKWLQWGSQQMFTTSFWWAWVLASLMHRLGWSEAPTMWDHLVTLGESTLAPHLRKEENECWLSVNVSPFKKNLSFIFCAPNLGPNPGPALDEPVT